METIEDLKEKLSLVICVNRNLGKLCEYHAVNADGEEVLQMGRIVGYNVDKDNCVVIVERFKNDNGWSFRSAEDIILMPPFSTSTYAYKVLNEITVIV